MANADIPTAERAGAVETDIKDIRESVVRIERSVRRIERVLIRKERPEVAIESIEDDVIRETTRKMLAAISYDKTVAYVMCGTVIVLIVAVFAKEIFL